MIFRIFTFLLKHLWTRKFLLITKKSRCIRSMIKMLNDWYEKTYICQIPQTNLVGHGSLDCLSNELNKLGYHTMSLSGGYSKWLKNNL